MNLEKWAKKVKKNMEVIEKYENSRLNLGEIWKRENITPEDWHEAFRWYYQINRF